jgi:hypothetical protein
VTADIAGAAGDQNGHAKLPVSWQGVKHRLSSSLLTGSLAGRVYLPPWLRRNRRNGSNFIDQSLRM